MCARAALPLSSKRWNSSRSSGVRLLISELLLEQVNDPFQLSVDLLEHSPEPMENLLGYNRGGRTKGPEPSVAEVHQDPDKQDHERCADDQ